MPCRTSWTSGQISRFKTGNPLMPTEFATLSHSIKIGQLVLAHNVILSPMVGVTDAPFRRLCARGGSALMCGEMLSAQAIKFSNAKTLHLLKFFADERPLSSQICGSEPELMALAAQRMETAVTDI